jgi:hypothetical protein
VIDRNGSVGIGTVSPTLGSLVVENNGQSQTNVNIGNAGSTNAALTFKPSASTKGWQISANQFISGDLEFTQATANGGDTFTTPGLTISNSGLVNVVGQFTAGTKTFQIPHPLPELKATRNLIHACLEGPRLDLIYRSTVTLVDGAATVDLDDAAGMSAGTWALLCRDAQVFTTNETGWFHVRGPARPGGGR